MISRRARLALAVMLDVARLARGKPMAAKDLAAHDGLAPRQIESVLQDLVHADLLRSIRGPHGGYELARERRRISAGDIVRAIEVGLDSTQATGEDAVIERLVGEATDAFLARLDAVSIEDLCKRTAPDAPRPVADFHI